MADEKLKEKLTIDSKKFEELQKDREKAITNRRVLEGQLTENKLVKEELDLLAADATIYKMVGPALIKQDGEEARSAVNRRIEYITNECSRVDAMLEDNNKQMEQLRAAIMNTQKTLEQIYAKAQNART